MTKTFVHIYVENLLKLLKLLKTRKRARNGLNRIPLRSIRQGAKAPFKTKKYYNLVTTIEKRLDK
jgi:hypothetical protein